MLEYVKQALHKIYYRKFNMGENLQKRIDAGDSTITPKQIDMHEKFRCCVCAITRNEMFMVHDHVWAEAGFAKADFACFPCFVNRIKRPLTIDDFMQALGNEMLFHGYAIGVATCETQMAKSKS